MKNRMMVALSAALILFCPLFGEQQEPSSETTPSTQVFTPFTGRITGNKVRLRSRPTIEAPIVDELHAGEMFIIQSEDEEFYSVKAPKSTKAYLHRKFIIDNTVEGTRVNVRLAPSLDAPIIGQLNTGAVVQGQICEENPKWMEISTPEDTRFYVAKDYVEKVGGPEVYHRTEKWREKICRYMNDGKKTIENELAKPFQQINLDKSLKDLEEVVKHEEEFPEQAKMAKEWITRAKADYFKKKIAHLESLTQTTASVWSKKNNELQEEIQVQQNKVKEIENKILNKETQIVRSIQETIPEKRRPRTPEMQAWDPVEMHLYEQWASTQSSTPKFEDFYADQSEKSVSMKGVVVPYNRNMENRPGDYLLVSEHSHTPIACLYSTQIDLHEHVGETVQIRGLSRWNNNFAFPAYFVLSIGH